MDEDNEDRKSVAVKSPSTSVLDDSKRFCKPNLALVGSRLGPRRIVLYTRMIRYYYDTLIEGIAIAALQ